MFADKLIMSGQVVVRSILDMNMVVVNQCTRTGLCVCVCTAQCIVLQCMCV